MESNRATPDFLKHQTSTDERSTLLQVPQFQVGQRSRSVESSSIDSNVANYLEVPRRFQRRRSSNTKSPLPCVHCQCLDEYERIISAEKSNYNSSNEALSISSSDSSSSDDDDNENDIYSRNNERKKTDNLLTLPPTSPCNIKFSLSPTSTDFPTFPLSSSALDSPTEFQNDLPSSQTEVDLPVFNIQPSRARRRSISRQEAIFIEPTGNSLENVSDAALNVTESNKQQTTKENADNETFKPKNDFVQDIYLAVPDTDLKRDRAASVDSSFSKLSSNGKTEELQSQIDGFALTVPSNAVRSRSVDIVLPTNEQARYKALALAGPSISKRYVDTTR